MASLTALCLVGPGVPARADRAGGADGRGPASTTAPDPGLRGVGIQLLEAPVERQADPRAKRYIVDHLPPGSVIRRQILVANRSPTRQRIELYPAGASISKERFIFEGDRAGDELASWISLDRGEVVLEPRGEIRIRATITVPPDASSGERYAVIWASIGSAGPQPTANVKQVQRIGIRTYLDIGPGGEPASDFKIGELIPARDKRGEPSITIKVTNTGGRALDLTGSVELSDGPAGMRAGPFAVVQGTTLAPGDSGRVLVRFPVELPNGPWKIQATLESGMVSQTMEGEVTFPDPGKVGEPTLLFVRLGTPWTVAGWSLVVGLVILTGLFFVVRRSRGRHRMAPAPDGPVRWRRG